MKHSISSFATLLALAACESDRNVGELPTHQPDAAVDAGPPLQDVDAGALSPDTGPDGGAPPDAAACQSSCADLGLTSCASGELRVCGRDADGCLNWSAPSACSDGICADSTSCGACTHSCPQLGATDCSGSTIRSCGADPNGCRSWSSPLACAEGFCGSSTSCGACVDECAQLGVTECAVGSVRSCLADANGCRHWSNSTSCPAGFCADASSCGACAHGCSTVGATECSAGSMRTCVADTNGCRSWLAGQACENGTCADSSTCFSCTHECAQLGETSCAAGALSTCLADPNGCRSWSSAMTCQTGVCADATSCSSCASNCSSPGEPSCGGALQSLCAEVTPGCFEITQHACALGCADSSACAACDPMRIAEVARVAINPNGDNYQNAYAHMSLVGTHLLITQDDLVEVYDVSNPAAPSFVTSVQSCAYPDDAQLIGTTLFVACFGEVRRFDVSSPAMPSALIPLSVTGGINSLAAVGTKLYVSGYEGLWIFDVAVSTTAAGYLPISDLGELAVSGSYAYVAVNLGIHVIDVSNPTNPRLVGGTSGSVVHGFAEFEIVQERLFATAQNPHTAVPGVQVYDISAAPALTLVGSTMQGSQFERFALDGSTLYASWAGLAVFDISGPNPSLVGQVGNTGTADVLVNGSYVYVTGAGDLVVLAKGNVSRKVHDENVGNTWAVVERGGFVYTIGNALRTFDATNPASPILIDEQNFSGNRIKIFDGRLYALGPDGVNVYDLANPRAPRLLASVPLFLPNDFWVAGHLLIVSADNTSTFEYEVMFYDLSNLAQITKVGSQWLDNAGPLVYKDGYLFAGDSSFSGSLVKILFVPPVAPGSPVTPLSVGQLNRGANALDVIGNTLIISGAHLAVYDISAPTAPSLLFERQRVFFDRTSVDGRYLLGVDDSTVVALDLSDPSQPREVVRETWAENVHHAVSVGPYTYVGAVGGLRVVERCAP